MNYNKHQIEIALKKVKEAHTGLVREHCGFIVVGSNDDVIKTKIKAIDRGDVLGFYRVDDLVQQRLREIEKEIDIIEKQIEKKESKWDFDKPFPEYWEHIKPEKTKVGLLYAEKRMIISYKTSKLPDYGHVMKLKEFIDACEATLFVDSDGYGNYVIDNKMTDIEIHPSDVGRGMLREEFDEVIWFNK